MALKAKKAGTVKALKASLKRSSGDAYLQRIPKEGGMTVRFLTEPDEWVEYYEHYTEAMRFFACSDDCPGCDDGDKPSKRYLTRAVDRGDNRVVPLVIPTSLAKELMVMYDKYSTMADRDYELIRSGTGQSDTTYKAIPEPPAKFNASRYEGQGPTDLYGLLEENLKMALGAANTDDDDDDDDFSEDDDAPVTKRTRTNPPKKAPVRKKAPLAKAESTPVRKKRPLRK